MCSRVDLGESCCSPKRISETSEFPGCRPRRIGDYPGDGRLSTPDWVTRLRRFRPRHFFECSRLLNTTIALKFGSRIISEYFVATCLFSPVETFVSTFDEGFNGNQLPCIRMP